jgi:hypothetical protein
MKCAYSGLTGLIIDELPESQHIRDVSAEAWQKAIQHYVGKDNTGVASVFLGVNGFLDYSRIHKLKTKDSYQPNFQVKEGIFVPSMSLCGGLMPIGNLSEEMQTHAAMRELLIQSLDHLEGERQGRYFLMTPYSKGCCNFKKGVIEVKKSDLLELLNEKYKI